MGNENRPSKQVDFRIRIGGMLLLFATLVCVYGKPVVAKTNETTMIYTSTESVLNKSYEELIDSLDENKFGAYLSTLEQGDSYIIPGIDKTNIRNEQICSGMIPQGVCVAGDYLIISAYDSTKKMIRGEETDIVISQKSVLYVMDVDSQEYLTTITLDTKCHVGALAYNPDDALIYVADSTKNVVQMLSMDKIEACVSDGQDTKSETVVFEEDAIDTNGYTPSFLSYYQEHLYVGQFAKNKKDSAENAMVVFERDGTLVERDSIEIPYRSQGVAFTDWKGETYMLVSTSYGRNAPAKMHVYLMNNRMDDSVCLQRKIGEFSCPNMSEDIDVLGDRIYTCYESASNLYRLALDNNGESSNVVDRIMVSSFRKTLGALIAGDAMRFVHKLRALPIWHNPRIQVYMDADQRRRLFLRLSFFVN